MAQLLVAKLAARGIVQLGQDRERAVREDTRDFDRLVGEVERCVMGELSADELLAAEGGSAESCAVDVTITS